MHQYYERCLTLNKTNVKMYYRFAAKFIGDFVRELGWQATV